VNRLAVEPPAAEPPAAEPSTAEPPVDGIPPDDPPDQAPEATRAPAVPGPSALLGWGLFATAVAVVVAVLTGGGWSAALSAAGLGTGTTLVLWAAVRAAGTPGPSAGAAGSHRKPRLRPGRPHRRVEPGHAAKSALGPGVKYPRDKRKR
jgi:hypothetical protein